MAVTLQRKGSILLAKGIDTSLPPEYLQDQFAVNSINFDLVENILQKRSGYELLGTASTGIDTTIMTGILFRREDVDYNIRVTMDNVESYNSGTEEWSNIAHTTLTGSQDDLVSLATPLLSGQPILVITNGIDNPMKWTGSGSTADLGGTPPKAKFFKEFKTYLVGANIRGGVDNSVRVQWCDTALPESWSTGNAGALDLIEDNTDITGLSVFGDYICVHKESSIYLGYLVNTTAIFQFKRINTGIGTIANGSIVNVPTGEQIFLAKDGLRVFNGITANLIDAPINDEIRRTLNKNNAHRAWGVLVKDKDEAWFGIPTGSEEIGQTIYKFNYIKRTIHKDVMSNANCAWIGVSDAGLTWDDFSITWDNSTIAWNDSAINNNEDLINIGKTDGETLVSSILARSDNSVAINAYYDSKEFQDDQESICRWQQLQLWAKGDGTLTVQYSVDGGDTWNNIVNGAVTLPSEYPTFDNPQVLYFDVVSSKIQFRFTNNSSTDSVYIKQFVVGYRPVGVRR